MWTDQERGILEELGQQLRNRGWADHVSVERLLRDWQQLASEVGTYRLTIDDFPNDLTSRDGLEEVLLRCPSEALREKLRSGVNAADEQYCEATREDGGAALSNYLIDSLPRP
jgi:hypothetical protein